MAKNKPSTPAQKGNSDLVDKDAAKKASEPLKMNGGAIENTAPAVKASDILEDNQHNVGLFLLLVSFATRFYRLDKPNGVVFDEYHFGRFTNQYFRRTYLFDIHPPLGKLVLALVAYIAGYDADTCAYNNIHDEYGPDCKFIVLRATAAFFGSITAIVLFYIARNFGGSVRAATLTSLFFIFDGLNLIEDRLILIDSQLIFWCAATLLAAQFWWMRWNVHWKAVSAFERISGQAYTLMESIGMGKPDLTNYTTPDLVAAKTAAYNQAHDHIRTNKDVFRVGPRVAWATLMGVLCANCISIKFTGLATPGMIAVESFFAFFFLHRAVPIPDLLLIAFVVVCTFVFYYFIHFSILTKSGDGDAFMSMEFQQTLEGNSNYVEGSSWPPFLKLVYDTNIEMIAASARIEQRHAWESVWWEWPVNARGVLYYSKDAGHTYTEAVYLLGNPLVVWPLLVFLIAAALSIVMYARYRTDTLLEWWRRKPLQYFFAASTYCLIVFVLNLAPYVAVKRSCFIYHYMPALMYGEIMAGLVFDQVTSPKWRSICLNLLALVMLSGFLFYGPWVYAFALTPEGHERRRWLPRWD